MTRNFKQTRQARQPALTTRRRHRTAPAVAAALEPRRLFATLVVNGGGGDDTCIFDVTGGFINANMNGLNIPQPVGLWDDVQINLFEGDDTVEIRNTGDEPVNISLGSGTDFIQITPTTDDLDSISARVQISAGTDAANDLVEVFDIGDSGDDSYTILEDGPMKLRKGSADKLFWGEANLGVSVFLNEGNNTVTVDASVSMTGTDESLAVGGQGPGFGGGNDTCNFNGVMGADNTFRFNGGTGSDVLNVTGTNFSGSDATIFMDGGNSIGDTLNINDSGPADTYLFTGNRDTILLSVNTALAGEYKYIGTEAINLSATAVGADTFDIQELNADLSIDAGDGEDSFLLGDGAIDGTDFGSAIDIVINGGPGVDDVTIRDHLATVARTHTFGADVYDHVNLGTLDMTSISTATLNCGSAGDTIDVNFSPGPSGTLTVNGNGGADEFEVTPDITAAIQLNGGQPTTAPGDTLALAVGTLTGGVFTPGAAGAGSYDFPVRDVISFTGMENFPQAPTTAPGAPDLAAASDSGSFSTDNITNLTSLDFSGTGAPAGASVHLFRDGTSLETVTATAGGAYAFNDVAFPTGDDTFALTARFSDATTGLLSPASATLNVRVDTVAPAAPSVPDLNAASDTGLSSTDNVTRDNTPEIDGTVEANALVRLSVDGTAAGTDTTTAGGVYHFTFITALADGARVFRASAEDVAGNDSPLSDALSVTIDTVAPATPTAAPDLTAASDLGVSSTDNITRDNTPTFTGSAPGNHLVRLLSGGVEVGSVQVPLAGTTYSVTSSTLADGNRVMTTRLEDIAGNVSAAASPSLTVRIDTVAPTLTGSVFNFLTGHDLRFTFSEDVGGGIGVDNFGLKDVTNNVSIPSASLSMAYAPNTATVTFPGFSNGILTDAEWEMKVNADVRDIAGNGFAGTFFNFFFLNGDANRDRQVNLADFNILPAHSGQSNRNFSQRDFNYDHFVNIHDFNRRATSAWARRDRA
jgi:hypothetical protein